MYSNHVESIVNDIIYAKTVSSPLHWTLALLPSFYFGKFSEKRLRINWVPRIRNYSYRVFTDGERSKRVTETSV